MLAPRTLFLLLGILLVFAIGISRLFVLRFGKGDIFPPYSSFRADPLGSKAFYDSLAGMPDLKVSRNQAPLQFREDGPRAAIIYLGVPARYFSTDSDFATLQKLAAAGSRVIIGLQPAENLPRKEKDDKKSREAKDEKEKPKAVFAPGLWQVDLIKLPKQKDEDVQMVGLDQKASYHSKLGFLPQNAAWKTLYSVDEIPVIIERPYGLGSLVLLGDSYPLSNEALRKERRPALLSALLGNQRIVIFDETHFGVLEQPGIAALARRYHLHGVAATGLLLAILFLWRNLTPLFPRRADDGQKDVVLSGQTAHSGLINLLRRSISPKELPALCLAEWVKTAPPQFRPAAVTQATQVATQIQDSPLDRLAKINQLLNQKHHV